MNNSKVEQDFINWCQQLHPDINPYIFFNRYDRYSEENFPLIQEVYKSMHYFVHEKKPNVNFSFSGRVKPKRSCLIKNYTKIAENIEKIFNSELDSAKREKNFEKYFRFLLRDNPEKYNEIKEKTFSLGPAFDYEDSFKIIFEKLSKEEKDKLISRLGRTEDTFAFRLIVQSVDFPVQSIRFSSDSNFFITNQDGNTIPIKPAISINPEKDIIQSEKDNVTYVMINGKKEILNERNLLYPSHLSFKQRTLSNAQKDENGNLTLLMDSFVLNDSSLLDIVDINVNPNNNCIFVTDSNGETRNISSLLERGNLRLRKHDEESLIKEVYSIRDLMMNFLSNEKFQLLNTRSKNYIDKPKLESLYMALHDSFYSMLYGYSIEGQYKTLRMDDAIQDTGHDAYKKSKLESYLKNKILAKILSKDITAFDSSTPTLMKVLEDENVNLTEILGKNIFITLAKDNNTRETISKDFPLPIELLFYQTFHNTDNLAISTPGNSLPHLDFSNYENFMASRKIRNNAIKKEGSFPDIYDD